MHALMLLAAVDPVPADKDVTAGWTAFAVFIALLVAVGVIGWALAGSLRRARRNAEKGVFDETPEAPHRTR